MAGDPCGRDEWQAGGKHAAMPPSRYSAATPSWRSQAATPWLRPCPSAHRTTTGRSRLRASSESAAGAISSSASHRAEGMRRGSVSLASAGAGRGRRGIVRCRSAWRACRRLWHQAQASAFPPLSQLSEWNANFGWRLVGRRKTPCRKIPTTTMECQDGCPVQTRFGRPLRCDPGASRDRSPPDIAPLQPHVAALRFTRSSSFAAASLRSLYRSVRKADRSRVARVNFTSSSITSTMRS